LFRILGTIFLRAHKINVLSQQELSDIKKAYKEHGIKSPLEKTPTPRKTKGDHPT